ncbi:MAG: HAD family phosphatase [Thalassobaculum sp.]|uniref:HAD family hydrolase n=1 Tax=Thalassobaculum sp. TaxID=2022740 RepID=UPI0032EB6A24
MTERAIDAVVFDVGQVLIEWDPRHLYRRVFTHADATPDEARVAWFLTEVCHPAWNVEQDRGRSIADAEAEALARHPEMGPAIRSFYGRFQTMIPGPIPGTVAVLEALKAAGFPVHGLTNFGAETFPPTRARFGFLNAFDTVVVSGEEGVVKPDPRIYEILIERASLTPARTAFVDDSAANIEAAEKLGFQAHLFTGAGGFRSWLKGLGAPV